MNKRAVFAARLLLTAALLATCLYAAHKLEYLHQFDAVDNMIGAAPPLLLVGLAICLGALIWKRHTNTAVSTASKASNNRSAADTSPSQPDDTPPLGVCKRSMASLSCSSLVFAITGVLLALLLIPALSGNWYPLLVMPDKVPSAPDLGAYAPFAADSRAVTPHAPSTLSLADHVPALDGSTALYPVYAAFARAVYRQESCTPETVLCGNTRNAYQRIIAGDCDIIFVSGPSREQQRAAKNAGVTLVYTPIGREAFVFLVGETNPVHDLSWQQLKNIYSGKTAHWRTLGWPDGGAIVALQRPEGSGSQTGLQTIMHGLPMHKPRPVPDAALIGTGSMLRQVSAWRQGVQPVIGYSYRYYASAMYANPEARLLSVNGVEPSLDNIRNGSYPFSGSFYAVTNGEPQGSSKRLIDWIVSAQGQEIIRRTGYVPR